MRAQLHILDLPVDRIETALIVVPFFNNQRPLHGPAALLDWRLNGYLTDQLLAGQTQGVKGERYLVRSNGKISSEWVMFVGCGETPSGTLDSMQGIVDELVDSASQAGFKQVGIGLPAEGLEQVASWQKTLEQSLKSRPVQLDCQFSACDPSVYRN